MTMLSSLMSSALFMRKPWYLRGELLTYSVETLRLYAAYVEKSQKEKINLCEQVLRNTVLRYGYPNLEAAENHQRKRA